MLSLRNGARRHGVLLLLTLLLAGALMTGACGAVGLGSAGNSEASSSSSGSGFDSGSAFDGTTDAGGDSGSSSGSGDSGVVLPTTALLVQASPSLPDVRLCWSTNSGGIAAPVLPFPGDGVMPGSNYPGVPLGGVAAMSDATSLVGSGVTLYAVDAENLARLEQGQPAPLPTCDVLICGQGSNLKPPCLRYNLDYWPVAAISGSGVLANRDNVVALSGCLPNALDPNASLATCGSTYDATNGNLHADVLQLVPTAPAMPPSPLGAIQAAQLSPALEAFEGDGGVALVSFGAQGSDAGVPVASLYGEGDLSAQTGVVFEAGLPGYGQLGFAVDVAGGDGGAGHLWMSLADSQQLIDPTTDPTQFFGQRRTYLVAVLGDPNAPHAFAPATGDAGYDGKGLHVLVVAAPMVDSGAGDGGAADGAVVD